MRAYRLLALAALALGACGGDVCAGTDGACIALTIRGPGLAIDELRVHLDPDGVTAGSTLLGTPADLPLSVAVLPPLRTGVATLSVNALIHGQSIGTGTTQVMLVGDAHLTAEVDVGPQPPDATEPIDATVLDASSPDLLPRARRVFLAGPYLGDLGSGMSPTQKCNDAIATIPDLVGRVVPLYYSFGGPDPVDLAPVLENEVVVNLKGSVVAGPGMFWTAAHTGAIDLPSGATTAYVWTGFGPDGRKLSGGCTMGSTPQHPCNCVDWSSSSKDETGGVGDTALTTGQWANAGYTFTCEKLLYIMCLEK